MKRSLAIHEAAELEINEAADFYDLESPGLGNAFLDEIQKAIGQILLFPESAPEKDKIKTFNLRFLIPWFYSTRRNGSLAAMPTENTPLLAQQKLIFENQ